MTENTLRSTGPEKLLWAAVCSELGSAASPVWPEDAKDGETFLMTVFPGRQEVSGAVEMSHTAGGPQAHTDTHSSCR